MQKAYNPINWENYPSEATPLSESNLNKIDVALDEIDNRVVEQEVSKANVTDVLAMISDVSYNDATGIFTFKRKNGATFTLDTKLEKLAINWVYDSESQQLLITLEDGTKQRVDLSALLTQYEFTDSETLAFSADSAGKVTAIVKEGSIEEKHLQPNYLANVKTEVEKASASAGQAASSATESAQSAAEARNYAAAAAESAEMAEAIVGVQVTGVKGAMESAYRKGNVNLTAANIGAAAVSHTHNYVTGISASNNVLTVTKGDGSASTITLETGEEPTMRYNAATDKVEIHYEGQWQEWIVAGLQTYYLFADGMNYAEFALYGGFCGTGTFAKKTDYSTLNIGESLVFATRAESNGGGSSSGCVITKAIDLTRYSKLVFTYDGTQTSASYNYMDMFVTAAKATNMTATLYKELLAVYTSAGNGTVTLDVSNLSGEHYIAFGIQSGVNTSTLTISNIYLE